MSASSFDPVRAAVWIRIGIRAAPYCVLCGSCNFVVWPVVFKCSVLGGVIFSIFWCFLSFPGSEIKEVKDGEVLCYPNVLSCGPLEPQGGWTLGGEDPKYYKKSKLWKTARREWPDMPYPVPSKPTTPAEEEEEQDGASHNPEDIKELLAIHHSFTKLLEKMELTPVQTIRSKKLKTSWLASSLQISSAKSVVRCSQHLWEWRGISRRGTLVKPTTSAKSARSITLMLPV